MRGRLVSCVVTPLLFTLFSGFPARGACPPPGEATDLTFEPDGEALSWSPAPGNGAAILVHDLLRGTLPWSFSSPAQTVCLESNDGGDTMAVDAQIPAVGVAHYYAPRGETECGLGSLGVDSAGLQRAQGLQCGACLSDATCDDGLACNGVETCPGPGADCQAGTPISCGEFACSEAIGDCLTTCSDDVDCAAGFGCLEGACLETIDVTRTADEPDEFPGDGVCRSASGACTLRAAVQTVNALGSFRLIRLPEGMFLLTLPGTGEDRAETGDLDLLGPMAIRGASSGRTWVDAQQIDRTFHVGPDADVTLARLKVQRGRTPAPAGGGEAEDGGGILNEGSLRLLEVEVNASHTSGNGGGVANLGFLSLERSTVSFNQASLDGGGIFNLGRASFEVSTVSTNEAGGRGGGFYQDLTGGELDLRNVTIYRNGAADGGGLYWPGGTLIMTNTLLAGSISGGDCSGVPPSSGHNMAGDLSCDLTGDGDQQEIRPLLSELLAFKDSGIRTHYPLDGSPLDGAGDRAAEPPIDQNGVDTAASPTFVGSVAKEPPELVLGSGRLYRGDYFGIDIFETLLHHQVGHVATTTAGDQLQVHPDGTRLYSLYSHDLTVYNIVGDTLQWKASIQGQKIEAFDIHPSGAWLFLCGSGKNGGEDAWIRTIDTANDVITVGSATVPGTSELADCAAQSYSSGSILATTHQDKVAAFTANDALTPLATQPWPYPRSTDRVRRGPAGTFFVLDHELFPGPSYDVRLTFLSSHSAPQIPLLTLPATRIPPEGLAMHPDGTRVYVSLALDPVGEDLVEIVPTNPAQITFYWPDFANTIAVDPLGYYIYANGSSLTALSTSTHQVVAEMQPSFLHKGLAIKP